MSKVKIIPDLRFPEFENEGEWTFEELEQCLDYLQPTPYLVESTDYKDEYEIPVLTAGKTFILGYTNEKEGVFRENLPVIIFDDFTTASQFVDFPFKAKSSAMKILLAKNDNNIKFVYEAIKNFNYEVGVHQRHWISIFSKLRIAIPKNPQEQQKIASCLSSLDEMISAHSQKLDLLKDHKKGLMQNLFPQEGEKVPKYRFKEFENDGEWVEEPLSSKISVIDGDRGLNYPKAEEYSSDGYCLFLSAKNVTKIGFLFNEFQFITKEKDELLRKGKLARFDIVLTTRGSLGQFAFFDENIQFENIRINSGMVILRAKDNGINPNYLYSYFNSNSIQSAIKSQGFGNAVQQLTVAVINNFTLRYPYSPKEQQKIAYCLSSLDALITAQAEKIEQLKLHKKGLMQGLFPKINE